MATKRRPLRTSLGANSSNFRPGGPDVTRAEARGTRPTAAPTSIQEILLMMVIHVCKKTIFFDTNLKVALYLGSLFLVSLIGDFLPFPKTYFARSDNLFNQYFVKVGWGWTLLLTIPFLVMSSYTLTCGDFKKMVKHHLPRLAIATFFWFFWTKLFYIIETSYGRCTIKGFNTKSSCLKAGHLWHGFDISGHAFILIYSSLMLVEEARPIIKWETIKEHLRNELHNRSVADNTGSNPLRYLKDDQIRNLRYLYGRLTPAIRTLFIGMAALQLLWDVMLVGTMLYYHRMIEKVLSGIIAILTWYFTYRFWYPSSVLPEAPGSAPFFYQRTARESFVFKRPTNVPSSVNSSFPSGFKKPPSSSFPPAGNNVAGNNADSNPIPSFMGMPLYTSAKAASAGAAAAASVQQNTQQMTKET